MKKYIHVVTFLLLFLCSASQSRALDGPVATDLSTDFINITTDFDGSVLTIYGVKDVESEVIVILRGPEQDVTVRKKERTPLGWRYTKELVFEKVPSFYSLVSTKPVREIVNSKDLKKFEIGREHINIQAAKLPKGVKLEEFKQAAFRNLSDQNVFTDEAVPAHMINDEFFKINFELPHNVPKGFYIAQILTVKNKKIEDRQWHSIFIAQVGATAFISNWAANKPFLYGVLCAIFAIMAGLISNRLKRIL